MRRRPATRWWDVEVVRHLPRDFRAGGEARQALASLASDLGEETLATLQLLASELVTNIVMHGRSAVEEPIDLAAFAARGRAFLEVSNADPAFDPASHLQHATGGSSWSLQLLAALSKRWGTERNERTVVWCEVGPASMATHRS